MDDSTRRRVVLTGGAGGIGRSIAPVLADRWELQVTDLRAGDGVTALDVTDADACGVAFAGADAVVHLAANPSPEATWDDLLGPNVVGAHSVASAAAAAGVRRLVLASSLHTVSSLPAGRQARRTDQPCPANLYGATKAWAEALGSWVAATSATTVVAVRVGWFHDGVPDAEAQWPVDRSAWLSPRDAAELFRAAVEAEVDGFVVVGGTSANRYPKVDVGETVRLLGYAPRDDAWA